MIIYSEKKSIKWTVIELIITLIINALVLMLASTIFKGFYIESFWYAILTSIVIMFLNKTIKPILKFFAFPITILSLGILYPIVDVIVIKIASIIIGAHFNVEGWFVPFFITIFISMTTVVLDAIITKSIIRGRV